MRLCGSYTQSTPESTPRPSPKRSKKSTKRSSARPLSLQRHRSSASCRLIGLYNYGKYNPAFEVDTGLGRQKLAEIADGLVRTPAGFHVHPKIVKLHEQRSEMGHGKRPIDFGFAELLAYGSLVLEGNPVRLTGQDSQRGTFNQRHAVLVDNQTEQE